MLDIGAIGRIGYLISGQAGQSIYKKERISGISLNLVKFCTAKLLIDVQLFSRSDYCNPWRVGCSLPLIIVILGWWECMTGLITVIALYKPTHTHTQKKATKQGYFMYSCM